MKRYSPYGSDEWNTYIDTQLFNLAQEISQSISDQCIALVLGGGYGRGEGACVRINGKESLYNDLDFFLVVKNPMKIPPSITAITESYEEKLGVDVDIGKPLTISDIKNLPHELMWQDLVDGHQVVFGPADIITLHAPEYLQKPLPTVEALRLMLNRGSGLLQAIIASYKLKKDPTYTLADRDFIRRNKEKALLAFGDSLLISHSLYTPHIRKRKELLTSHIRTMEFSGKKEILALYEEAIQFKMQPDLLSNTQPSLSELEHIASIWVQLMLYEESRRTSRVWKEPETYATSTFIREPNQHRGKFLIRNVIKNIQRKKLSFRYPREQLYGQLVTLLATCMPEESSWMDASHKFLNLWHVYN